MIKKLIRDIKKKYCFLFHMKYHINKYDQRENPEMLRQLCKKCGIYYCMHCINKKNNI